MTDKLAARHIKQQCIRIRYPTEPDNAPLLETMVVLLCLVLLSMLQGCASLYKPQNDRIATIDNHKGYRLASSRNGDFGEHLIFLAFSGGGTRAAALSYGVLKELEYPG